jgi:hypothetical protein
MSSTYEPIATGNLAGQTSVTFNSFSGYTDLILIGANLTRGTATSTFVRFNGDTASNYSWTQLVGNGSSATSSRASNQAYILVANGTTGLSATNPTMFTLQIFNYANATTNKTILSRDTDSAGSTEAFVGLWRKTPEAITSLTIFTGGNYTTGSLSLYGIKAE